MGQGHTECEFGTRNALLRYGIDTRCSKQPPVVRDAFSEALGVKNRLFWYGRDIRCTKTPFCGTRRIFKGPQNSRLHRLWTASCRTGRISEACRAKSSLLPHRTHLQCAKRPPLSLFAPAAPSLVPSTALGTRNGPRSDVSRRKKTSKSIKTF